MVAEEKRLRIGIYAGTFDPVHAGHLSFALHASAEAKLDEVYFLPERMPRHKQGAEHYGHRVAMLKRAIEPHSTLCLAELADKRFTFARTLPQLKRLFAGAQLVLLMGTDVFVHMPEWPEVGHAARDIQFAVSIRSAQELPLMLHTMQQLKLPVSAVTIVDSLRPDVSSTQVRQAIGLNQTVRGLLPSVQRYAAKQWLYVQVPNKISA